MEPVTVFKSEIYTREAEVYRALGHPWRLRLLEALRGGEECVCHLAALLGKPQPYISQHLAALREAGLVVDRREGLRIYYRLADPSIGTVIDAGRLQLLKAGKMRPEEAAPAPMPRYPVSGCDCPRCRVA